VDVSIQSYLGTCLFRVRVEHAIGGSKRYAACRDIYRNKSINMDDKFHLLSAGLWNLHLQTLRFEIKNIMIAWMFLYNLI